jgi:hypothetical protein
MLVGILSGSALTERILDPFDRHELDYQLEGGRVGEVLHASINAYDEHGEKHDDRVGDAYMLGIILGFGGAALLRALEDERTSLAETA